MMNKELEEKETRNDEQGTRRERDKKISCEEKLCDFDMSFNLLLWLAREVFFL
jgi:hypothetical protein